MLEPAFTPQLDLTTLGRLLHVLGSAGFLSGPADTICSLLISAGVVAECKDAGRHHHSQVLVATNHLFILGPSRSTMSAIRRVMSLCGEYREHLLDDLCTGLKQLPDDKALADTLEHLDHLACELLTRLEAAPPPQPSPAREEGVSGMASSCECSKDEAYRQFEKWDTDIWQAPDAITLLAKVVESPADFPERPFGPKVAVGFDWLSWETPPATPAPAPWGDREPLCSPLATAQHPFWGALVATLDACTGDYAWQSLMLRGGILRSRHRTLGSAEVVMHDLWSRELGLYPVAPLVLPEGSSFVPGKPIPWLQPALEHMADAGVAMPVEGSCRLTDAFRTQLMQDDAHMLVFEAVRKRSYRLAHAAEQIESHMLYT
jgi:hypothetical protein